MSEQSLRPGAVFNDEDSNRSDNATFDSVLDARLSRRRLLGGGAAVAAGAAVAGCATPATNTASGPVQQLGFTPVARSVADTVSVPAGYTAQVLYAGGDPLKAGMAAFKNDGTDNDWGNRAGDHHDGIEWFGLDASGKPSDSFSSRGLLAMNHEATTDEKLSSFFIHTNGGASTLPRPASEVDKELAIHGLSFVEVQSSGKQWAYKTSSPFNRRVTTMTTAAIHGPARGSEHLVTKFSTDATLCRGTLNNCGTGKTPWGTFVSGEENWYGYFSRDAKDDDRRQKDKQVQALNRYGRKAGAPSRHGWESGGASDTYTRWNNSALGASAKDDFRNEMNTFGYIVELDPYDKTTALRRIEYVAPPKLTTPEFPFLLTTGRNLYQYNADGAAMRVTTDELLNADYLQARAQLIVGDGHLNGARASVDGDDIARANGSDLHGQLLEGGLESPPQR